MDPKVKKTPSETKSPEDKKEKIEKLTKRIEELENQVKRTLADYQNLEKRALDEKRSLVLNANKQLLLRLLPVLDTLMLALRHAEDKGLELSVKQFLNIIKTEGVSRIDTEDKMFDPKLMECVDVAEGEEGKVIAEARAGYLLNTEVLRPAMVRVGRDSK